MKKVYAVKKGKTPGLYYTWDECKAQVEGFSGAQYKGFTSEEEAYEYLGIKKENSSPQIDEVKDKENIFIPDIFKSSKSLIEKETPFAYVDGSYNIKTKVYGYGGFLSINGEREYIQGNGNDEEMASMRNVAGEILGAIAAIQKALELGLKELTIYYDYEGIEKWATGKWKTNKVATKQYAKYCKEVGNFISLNFVHVKGHTGVEGNEIADKMAKEAVGV